MFHKCSFIFCCSLILFLASSVSAQDATSDSSQFSEHLIFGEYSYPYGIAAADLDGDGDIDLTSADCKQNDCLYWFENDREGNFKHHFAQKNEPIRLERHQIGDINQDGFPDVVAVKNLHGHLVWFQNSGKPQDGELWRRNLITTELPGAYDVTLADFDGDGDLDVAGSSWVLGNQFAWFENGNLQSNHTWTKHVIAEKRDETRTCRAADLDGDGDIDLLGTISGNPVDKNGDGVRELVPGRVVWYENQRQGNKSVWKEHVIDDCLRPMHGEPVDMDLDGDLDVVMANGMSAPLETKGTHEIVWYENGGSISSDSTWEKHIIDNRFPDAFEAVAGDLDGDGDIDVAATSWRNPGRVVWYENQGNPKQTWKLHPLKENWRSANQIIITDLNGDKRLDLAAIAEHGSYELRWWKNLGTATQQKK